MFTTKISFEIVALIKLAFFIASIVALLSHLNKLDYRRTQFENKTISIQENLFSILE